MILRAYSCGKTLKPTMKSAAHIAANKHTMSSIRIDDSASLSNAGAIWLGVGASIIIGSAKMRWTAISYSRPFDDSLFDKDSSRSRVLLWS